MNRADAPTKQGVPFGVNGNREPIEATTPAGDNSASYDVGFPPITMILKAAGGLPPKGQDMNQILFELSSLARWASTGAVNRFDSVFAAAIGGYPQDAQVLSSDGNIIWRSSIDNNTNDPNTNPTGWIPTPSNPYPVGAPIPWPSVVPPSGFLVLNGQSFNTTTYPKLATLYPSGVLPDLRAKFIRGFDDGLGIDPGRAILSVQNSQNLSHYHVDIAAKGGSPGGALASGSLYAKSFYAPSSDLMTAPTGNWSGPVAGLQTTSSGGNESRPININFYYIVRAA